MNLCSHQCVVFQGVGCVRYGVEKFLFILYSCVIVCVEQLEDSPWVV